MCLAIPGKVIEIKGKKAVVDYGFTKRTASIEFEKPEIGDYVLVKGGIVIEIVDKKTALHILSSLKEAEKQAR